MIAGKTVRKKACVAASKNDVCWSSTMQYSLRVHAILCNITRTSAMVETIFTCGIYVPQASS